MYGPEGNEEGGTELIAGLYMFERCTDHLALFAVVWQMRQVVVASRNDKSKTPVRAEHQRIRTHAHPRHCCRPLPLALSSPHYPHFHPSLTTGHLHALTNALDNMCESSTCHHRASPSTGDDEDDSTLD
jgi:hypothetical protein